MYYRVVTTNTQHHKYNHVIPSSCLINFVSSGVALLDWSGRRDQLRGAATMQAKCIKACC